MKKIAAIDLGATRTKLASFLDKELQGSILIQDTPQDPHQFVEMILELIDKENLSAIGVGAPGFWDQNCILRQSLNLPQYIDFPLWSQISEKLKVPVFLKTDVELAAMGEAIYGLNNEFTNLLYLSMGTGLGGGLYKDGEIFSTNYSPTLRLDFMVHPQLASSGQSVDLESVAVLASTLINLACILSPQVIVIGGGKVDKNWNSIIAPAIENAMDYLSKVLIYPIKIQRSKLEFPALYGAMHLCNN